MQLNHEIVVIKSDIVIKNIENYLSKSLIEIDKMPETDILSYNKINGDFAGEMARFLS